MKFNFDQAKEIYLELKNIYNNLPDEQKTRVYEDLKELYEERKSAEKLFLK